MKLSKKIILGVTLSSFAVIGIATPTIIYFQNKNYNYNQNKMQSNIENLYCKELLSNDLKQTSNDSALSQYNNLKTFATPLYQLVNGDVNVNNGNYLMVIGNQLDLSYQALSYNNFTSTTYLSNYHSIYNSVLNHSLDTIGWRVPVFEYVLFPHFINQYTFKQSQMGLFEAYVKYAPQYAKEKTLEDKLYLNLISYVKSIWSNASSNYTLVIAFIQGKAYFWNQKPMSDFISVKKPSTDTNGGTQLPTNPLTQSTKQSIISSYQKSLNTFFKNTFNNPEINKPKQNSAQQSTNSNSSLYAKNLLETYINLNSNKWFNKN